MAETAPAAGAAARRLSRVGFWWAALACVVWGLVVTPRHAGSTLDPAVLRVVAVVAAASVPFGLRWPLVPAVVATAAVAVTGLTLTNAVVAVLVGARARRPALALAVLSASAFVLLLVGSPTPVSGASVVADAYACGTVVVLPGIFGLLWRANAARAQLAQDRAQELERRREQDAQQAALSERLRISRGMHDGLGHRISLMVLALSGVDAQLDADPQRARELLRHVQDVGREAMTQLRAVVLDEAQAAPQLEPAPAAASGEQVGAWAAALADAVQRARDAGLPLALHVDLDARMPLPARVGGVLARAAEEGLANVAQHAGGAETQVRVSQTVHDARVVVRNAAPAARHVDQPGAGTGLVRLRAEANDLGGRLRAEPLDDGGFVLEVWLPTDGGGPR